MALYAHILADKEFVAIPELVPDLCTDRLLTMSWLSGERLDAYEAAPQEVVTRVRAAGPLKVNNGDMLREAMLAGTGFASLPTFIIGDDLKSGALERVLPDWCVPPIALHAVYPPGKALSAKVRLMIDHLVTTFSPVPPWDAFEE